MAAKLQFDLVSPERLLLAEEVDMVTVPGTDGEFGVLAGHAPLVSTLKPGFVSVKNGNQPEQRIFVRGGFAEVGPRGLTVLAEEAMPASELNIAVIDSQIRDAEAAFKEAGTTEHRASALEALDRLRELRAAFM